MGAAIACLSCVKIDKDSEISSSLMKPGCIVVDANTANAFRKRHAADAVNLDVSANADEAVKKLMDEKILPQNKDVPIVCYCTFGVSAKTAKEALERAGFKNVLNAGSQKKVEYLKGDVFSVFTQDPKSSDKDKK